MARPGIHFFQLERTPEDSGAPVEMPWGISGTGGTLRLMPPRFCPESFPPTLFDKGNPSVYRMSHDQSRSQGSPDTPIQNLAIDKDNDVVCLQMRFGLPRPIGCDLRKRWAASPMSQGRVNLNVSFDWHDWFNEDGGPNLHDLVLGCAFPFLSGQKKVAFELEERPKWLKRGGPDVPVGGSTIAPFHKLNQLRWVVAHLPAVETVYLIDYTITLERELLDDSRSEKFYADGMVFYEVDDSSSPTSPWNIDCQPWIPGDCASLAEEGTRLDYDEISSSTLAYRDEMPEFWLHELPRPQFKILACVSPDMSLYTIQTLECHETKLYLAALNYWRAEMMGKLQASIVQHNDFEVGFELHPGPIPPPEFRQENARWLKCQQYPSFFEYDDFEGQKFQLLVLEWKNFTETKVFGRGNWKFFGLHMTDDDILFIPNGDEPISEWVHHRSGGLKRTT